jgi:hypothetical protein
MLNVNLSRTKAGPSLKKLTNGDKVGIKVIKERVVLAAELLFVSELGDYNGITLRMKLDEAKQLQQELAEAIQTLETELANAETIPQSEN